MSTTAQKAAVKEFRAVTGATDAVANAALKKVSYNLERALDAHYAGGRSPTAGATASAPAKTDPAKLNTLFTRYAGVTDRDKDVMYDQKLADFFTAIGLDPSGGATLGVAWKLKAGRIGEISRKEFCDGFTALNCDSVEKITAAARSIQSQLDTNPRDFKEFYKWIFDLVKEEGERKTIDAQVAIDMWNLVFLKQFPLLPKWVTFIQEKGTKTVSRDVWLQLFDFAKDVKPDLSNFDPDGAWPGIIDEFVTFVRAAAATTAGAGEAGGVGELKAPAFKLQTSF
jgi:DCN1-like protein 1/2